MDGEKGWLIVVSAISTAIGVVSKTVYDTFVLKYKERREDFKEDRTGAKFIITEYQKLGKALETRIDTLEISNSDRDKEMAQMRRDHRKCEEENAKLTAGQIIMEERMNYLLSRIEAKDQENEELKVKVDELELIIDKLRTRP